MMAWKAWASMGPGRGRRALRPQGAFRLHGAAELCDSERKDLCFHPPILDLGVPSGRVCCPASTGQGVPTRAPSHLPEAPVRRLPSTGLHHHWGHRDGRLGEKKS